MFSGARDVKRPEDGLPPVLLRLHRESTFTDTTYSPEGLRFANHHGKASSPLSSLTELYSAIIADFSKTWPPPNWNANVLGVVYGPQGGSMTRYRVLCTRR
jgi:hypothetical protein